MSDERYPNGNDYEVMYRKYFCRSPMELIGLVKINKGDKIVDLCGGTGRLTKELLKLDCETTYFLSFFSTFLLYYFLLYRFALLLRRHTYLS